ncbi:MAG: putative phage tail protein [Anaerorhabdus sp.]|uniref:putative phage tail protein n=1 Tax=Anaerorhabdus sp. TaxID=1872524 RepID=UPI003A880688
MEKIKKSQGYSDFLPDILREIIEFKEIGNSIDIELDKYYVEMKNLLNNGFVESADLETIKRWEKIFNINSPIQDDLPSRRNAVKAQMMGQPPININTLKVYTEAYLGVSVSVMLHSNPYVISIQYKGIQKLPDMAPYYTSIYDLIPANIKVLITYAFRTWGSVNSGMWENIKTKSWNEVLYDL